MKNVTIAITMILLISSTSMAAELYVSPSGNGNECSETSPCAMSVAIKQSSANDRILVRGGTYAENESWLVNKDSITIRACSGETPILDANHKSPSGSFPTVLYSALIRVTGNNVTIDGITVLNSKGIGIDLQDTQHSTVQNCTVGYALGSGIKLGRKDRDGYNTADNCYVYNCNHSRDNGAFSAWTNIGQNVQLKGRYNTIKNSTVTNGPCAGIEGFTDEYSTIENNVLIANRLTQIHVATSRYATIRNNLIYGGERTGSPLKAGTDGYGTGIAATCELWYSQTEHDWDVGHIIYGNMIANTKWGIRLGYQTGKCKPNGANTDWETSPGHPNRCYPDNYVGKVEIYNNTVIDAWTTRTENYFRQAIRIDGKNDQFRYNHIGYDNIIKNNIFFTTQQEDLTYGRVPSAKIDIDYNLWSKAPEESFQGTNDPTYSGYQALSIGEYFNETTGWYGKGVVAESIHKSDFALKSSAVNAIDKGLSDTFYTTNINNAEGSSPDCGAKEYSNEDPTNPNALIYTLDANGDDTGSGLNLSAVGGTPDHTGGEGLVIDSGSDAGYGGNLGSSWNVDEITVIAKINPITLSSGETHPIVGRWDTDGEKNWALVTRYNSPVARFRIGTADGRNNENIDHTYSLSTSTDYYLAAVLNNINKTLSLWVFDTSGNSLGTDITNQPVLSGATWNNAETDLSIGYWLTEGAKSSRYVAHSNIKHVEIYPDTLDKATVASRIVELEGDGTIASLPVADAFLENGDVRNLDTIKLQNSTSRVRESYLKFSVSGINGAIVESAQLKVTCANDPGNGNLSVSLGSHNNWNEQNLADFTPAKEVLVDTMNSVYTSGTEYVFDVSSVISADGEYTFVMAMDSGGNDVSFHSSEGTVPPVLKINAHLTPPDGLRIQ